MYRILIAADIIMIAAFAFLYSRLPPQIPLFYSHTWGEEQIADIWYVALVPIILHIFFLINFFLYSKFFKGDQTVKNIINVTNFFLIVSFTFIFIRILLTVT